MSRYDYPQVQGGYRWNMLQRIKNAVGIEPTSSGDAQVDGAWVTTLTFDRDLTAPEKAQLDALMLLDPTQPPPVTGTRLIVKDLWEGRTTLKTASGGMEFFIYYSESTPGSGVFDQIELHFPTPLLTAQRNKVISEYGKLIA